MERKPLETSLFEQYMVLRTVFENIENPEDLKSVRLVSKTWKAVSIYQWRRVATIKLLWTEDVASSDRYCRLAANETEVEDRYRGALSMQEYMSLLTNSNQERESCPYRLWRTPFTRYKIGYCSLLQRSPLMERFWELCGDKIKYLNMDHYIVNSAVYSDVVGWTLSNRLSNVEELVLLIKPITYAIDFSGPEELVGNNPALKLKSVTLGFCRGASSDTLPQCSIHIRKWLHYLPNVKNLAVDSRAYFYLDALRTPNIQNSYMPLQSLTVPSQRCSSLTFYNNLKHYVRIAQPPLETLRISEYLSPTGGILSPWDFLRFCQNTLRHLEIRGYPTRQYQLCNCLCDNLDGLSFPHLTKLYLFGEIKISLRSLREVPNLQTLWIKCSRHIEDWNQTIDEEAEWEAVALRRRFLWVNLENFRCDYNKLTPNSLRVLGRWLPNLKIIELVLDENTRKIVTEIWPGAEVKALNQL